MADDSKELERRMELRTRAPFWWPDVPSLLQIFLTCAIVWMVGFVLTSLFSGGEVKIDPSARDLVMVIIGIILGAFKDVFGFAFGLSASDKQKSETINRSLETKDKIIAAGVEATAATAAAAAAPEEQKVVVSWWSLLTPSEQLGIESGAIRDDTIKTVLANLRSGNAEAPDLAALVAKGLLTKERSAVLQTANKEVKL